ncbi:hypothetical protein RFI_00541 [Reticulomyxa filosa]|uniref:Uncharacterized protein n=1 Tax=Reticulomyxa filosa TaxID=46433 RepID=X6PEI4_RETFI|nr:hypothetical protein RFI_00541 [Reticulomyxa filosa]|eukprot:ETO36518.1 hypothetical protein RFI_00541 [Reticulomyxa filosa]
MQRPRIFQQMTADTTESIAERSFQSKTVPGMEASALFPPLNGRSNAFKFAGYSFGTILLIVLGPIVLWPVADVYILPWVLCKSLERTPKHKTQIWGREHEIEQISEMRKRPANNVSFFFLCAYTYMPVCIHVHAYLLTYRCKDKIWVNVFCKQIWILSGVTNSGKTALLQKMESDKHGIIYIDLRHFFDGNAFVFEMIDALYNEKKTGGIGRFVGTYVKLFTFVTSLMAQSDQQITAMLYFHAMLNHLRAGIRRYNSKYGLLPSLSSRVTDTHSDGLPLIVFDHFEALGEAYNRCDSSKNREMLSFIMYSLGQFATSLCHDQGLAHVLFVGDELFTINKEARGFQLHEQRAFNPTEHLQSFLKYLSSDSSDGIHIYIHIYMYTGVDHKSAVNAMLSMWQSTFGWDQQNKEKYECLVSNANKLIRALGTKPVNIDNCVRTIAKYFMQIDAKERSILRFNGIVDDFISKHEQAQHSKLWPLKSNAQAFFKSLKKDRKMDWSTAVTKYFPEDKDLSLLLHLIRNGVIHRVHGTNLARTDDELRQRLLHGTDSVVYLEATA